MSTALSSEYAQISRELWDDYLTRFAPIEGELMESLEPATYSALKKDVQEQVSSGYSSAPGVIARSASRYGRSLSSDQNEVMQRYLDLNKAADIAGATNLAIASKKDTDRNTLTSLVELGRGIAKESYTGFGTSANLEGARNAANRQGEAAYDAQQMNMIGSVAGALFGFM